MTRSFFLVRIFIAGLLLCAPMVPAGSLVAGDTKGTGGAAKHPPLPFLLPDEFESLELLAWRVEQGRPDPRNPLVEPEMPWDLGGLMAHGTVLRDPIDGRWKAWQISTPPSRPYGPGTWTYDRRLTYLESEDGVTWRRPELAIVPWPGHRRTNILMESWCSYASVNIEPRREWPYEMFLFRDPGYPGAEARVGKLPLPPGQQRHPFGLYRFRSKNGTDWEAVAGPVQLATSDSCYIVPQGTGYVAYHKTQLPAFPGGLAPYDIADGGLRVLGRRASRDGIQWSDPTELVLTPDWRDPGDTQFMELNPMPYPGGYIATVAVYHTHTQTIDLQWSASRDGIRWWRPDRRPALPNAPLGDYGGGMIWPMRSPVLDGGRLHVYYGGTQGLHGDMHNTRAAGPRRLETRGESLSRQSSSLPDHSALCRASWQAHRLWALAPAAGGPYVGQAVTHRRALAMAKLRVNVLTRPDGDLIVEALDAQGSPVPGFTAVDCEPVRGDHQASVVKWKQNSVLPERAAKLRFLLRQAYLYGFDITGAEAPK